MIWQPIATCPEYEYVLLHVPGRECAVHGRKLTREDGIVWQISGSSAHEILMDRMKWSKPVHWQPLPDLP